MVRRDGIFILAFFVVVVLITSGYGSRPVRESALRDGFALSGVDGKLTRADSNEAPEGWPDRWLFELDSDVNNGASLVRAGTRLEVLPSSTLEKMVADMKRRSVSNYRLRARVTKYNGRNFIFPTYFLPLSKTTKQRSPASPKPRQNNAVTINEPNDILAMPEQITKRLKGTGIAAVERSGKTLKLKRDWLLIDRIGFMHGSGQKAGFTLDAVGRNAYRVRFRLLPCEALELAEQRQSAEPEMIRLKVAGIVTQYKGRQYLLLQKATQVYSCGNFPR